jgi:hypothetical protein
MNINKNTNNDAYNSDFFENGEKHYEDEYCSTVYNCDDYFDVASVHHGCASRVCV